MPGGNTSSSTHGLKNIKGTSQLANDVKALNATEIFANPNHLMIDAPGAESYAADVNYGLPISGNIPTNGENTQGNGTVKNVSPGPGVTGSRSLSGSKSPQPGGGW